MSLAKLWYIKNTVISLIRNLPHRVKIDIRRLEQIFPVTTGHDWRWQRTVSGEFVRARARFWLDNTNRKLSECFTENWHEKSISFPDWDNDWDSFLYHEFIYKLVSQLIVFTMRAKWRRLRSTQVPRGGTLLYELYHGLLAIWYACGHFALKLSIEFGHFGPRKGMDFQLVSFTEKATFSRLSISPFTTKLYNAFNIDLN